MPCFKSDIQLAPMSIMPATKPAAIPTKRTQSQPDHASWAPYENIIFHYSIINMNDSNLQQIPQRILPLFYYIAMAHAIASNISLPVDRVKIIVLPYTWYVIVCIYIENNLIFLRKFNCMFVCTSKILQFIYVYVYLCIFLLLTRYTVERHSTFTHEKNKFLINVIK